MITYTVKRGDTLSQIAKAHGTTTEALAASNGITNANLIFPGQILKIPAQSGAANNAIYNALNTCLDAIEDLPEFKTLCQLLGR